MTRIADLHLHSTLSDGTESVEQVVVAAFHAGMDVLAITDHDTVRGWPRANEIARAHGITAVSGLEMSTRCEGNDVHVLGYGVDPEHTGLQSELERIRSGRIERVRNMVERIAEIHPIRWDDLIAHTVDADAIGRPHIADALVRAGIVADRSEAFSTLLSDDSPFAKKAYLPSTPTAIGLIREAGGFPVVAHPASRMSRGITDPQRFRSWRDAGMLGIEVFHREHSASDETRLLSIAIELDLVTTGGSDYHGSGKPNRIGEKVTRGPALDAILAFVRPAYGGQCRS